jgi:oligopeptidase A
MSVHQKLDLARFSDFKTDQVATTLATLLAAYDQCVKRVCTDEANPTYSNTFDTLNRASTALDNYWAVVSHLHNVADNDALREAYNLGLEEITRFTSQLLQNQDLYQRFCALRDAGAALTATQSHILKNQLRDFELGGVALAEPMRTRFRELSEAQSKTAAEFEQALMDATEHWHLTLPDQSRLAGVLAEDLQRFAAAAADAGESGYRLSLHAPDYLAVMTYAVDRTLREQMYGAYQTRASDQGPDAGKFDNGPRIEQLLAQRHEAAKLLGFSDACAESLMSKMAGTPQRVEAFLQDLVVRAKPFAEKDMADLRAFARDQLNLADLQPWDVAFAAEKLKKQRFDLDDELLRPYFELSRVLDGLWQITRSVFGVQLRERTGVDTWHADVQFFEILNEQGVSIAGFYLDAFARNKKRGGAWMDVCRSRHREGEIVHLPIAYLNCNFAKPAPGSPSLLTHDDVITLFHEFGHGLHHMLTTVDELDASGIDGVEWDAVELPSQFMENFAWQRSALGRFAKHFQTGAAMSDDVYGRLLASKNYHAGLFLVRQLEFALFDFRLHREFDPARGARTLEILSSVRQQVAVIKPPSWQRFPMSFSHIFAGGYAAGYYSYLWAEVLSADAFAAFGIDAMNASVIGKKFRDEILAVGGSRPALESFIAFRGREPQPAALLQSYGLTA